MARLQKSLRRDFLAELERLFQLVFPGRSFGLPEPMYRGGVPTPDDYYFILNDGNRSYDIEEMSGGEQSVFPLLYEAVRLQFRHSVVLIDEVDLNLHPPIAQARVGRRVPMPGCWPNSSREYARFVRSVRDTEWAIAFRVFARVWDPLRSGSWTAIFRTA